MGLLALTKRFSKGQVSAARNTESLINGQVLA
jgi:hypothetical protein